MTTPRSSTKYIVSFHGANKCIIIVIIVFERRANQLVVGPLPAITTVIFRLMAAVYKQDCVVTGQRNHSNVTCVRIPGALRHVANIAIVVHD
jgi:hypothetical protein